MHELIRQYAADKLAQSPLEKEQTKDQHCAYYAEFMRQRDGRLESTQQLETVREIETELENIQLAWRRAIEQEYIETIDKLAWGLGFFYVVRSRFSEGLNIFASTANRLAVISDPVNVEKSRLYAQLLVHQGFFCFRLAQVGQAEELLQKSLPILRRLGPQRALALALHSLGLIVWAQGQYEQARQRFEESLPLAQATDQPWLAAMSRCWLGNLCHILGEHTQAEHLLRQSLSVLRELGKLTGLGLALNYLSRVVLALGRPTEAKALLEESLALSREVGNRWAVASSQIGLGEVLNLLGEAERREAKPLLQESVAIFREFGDRLGLVLALNQLGRVRCALSEYHPAWRHLQEALQIASQNQLVPALLNVLVSLAELQLQAEPTSPPLSEKEAALDFLALALNHPASEQTTKDRATRLLAKVEPELPPSEIEAAWERAKAKGLEAIVAETLRLY
jgi:tetratricopeptide (TPR) repeat protein